MLIDWEKNDSKVRELWKKMNKWVYEGFDATYKKLGVDSRNHTIMKAILIY